MATTNYKYLKENNLYDAHVAFMRMCEGYGYSPIEEAGDEEQQPQGGMPDPNAMGGAPDQGGMPDPNAMGGAPDQGGMPQDGGMPDPNAMGGDQGGLPDPNAMGDAPDQGGMPDVPDMPEEEPQEEEDVIDVDQLTKAQQKIFDRVNSVGKDLGRTDDRIDKLLGAIETMQGMIDRSNSEIEELRQEFEKRNPTQEEKLNMRSVTTKPYDVKPEDYWKKKEAEGGYSTGGDVVDKEYVITKDDIDNMSDRDIERSFVPDDLKQDINKIFGISR